MNFKSMHFFAIFLFVNNCFFEQLIFANPDEDETKEVKRASTPAINIPARQTPVLQPEIKKLVGFKALSEFISRRTADDKTAEFIEFLNAIEQTGTIPATIENPDSLQLETGVFRDKEECFFGEQVSEFNRNTQEYDPEIFNFVGSRAAQIDEQDKRRKSNSAVLEQRTPTPAVSRSSSFMSANNTERASINTERASFSSKSTSPFMTPFSWVNYYSMDVENLNHFREHLKKNGFRNEAKMAKEYIINFGKSTKEKEKLKIFVHSCLYNIQFNKEFNRIRREFDLRSYSKEASPKRNIVLYTPDFYCASDENLKMFIKILGYCSLHYDIDLIRRYKSKEDRSDGEQKYLLGLVEVLIDKIKALCAN